MTEDGVPSVNPKLDAMCEMLKTIHDLNERNKMLEAQIEKMKCCENCRWKSPSSFCDECKRLEGQIFSDLLTSDNWELNFGVSN